MKKVAIIGSVGIPAKYGGFETLVEFVTKELGSDFEITVYCSGKAYKERLKSHNNVKLKYVPLKANGIQSIPYDIWSMCKAIRKNDTLLILGVAGCAFIPWLKLFYKRRFIVHIDGCEWKRDKWNSLAKWHLQRSEKKAMRYADEIIADNAVIQEYTHSAYNKTSRLIEYGGEHVKPQELSQEISSRFEIPDEYAFGVCRIEPENNIHMILEAFSKQEKPLVFIGNWNNSEYGTKLKKQFVNQENLYLLDPIYEQDILDQLRSNCSLYVHGHSAGGTNPSLVEAMQLGLSILCFDVNYNRMTTEDKAFFFTSSDDLLKKIDSIFVESGSVKEMKRIALERYQWTIIASKYADLF